MYATNPDAKLYRILVRDLVLKCLIGIHAHELLAPQRPNPAQREVPGLF